MKIKIGKSFPHYDSLIIGGYEKESLQVNSEKIDVDANRLISLLAKDKTWKWEYGETKKIDCIGDKGIKTTLIVGLGKKKKMTPDKLKRVVAKLLRELTGLNKPNVAILLDSFIYNEDINECVYQIAESALLTEYEFVNYKSDWKDTKIKELQIISNTKESTFKLQLDQAKAVASATNFARDLVNEPANVITPLSLAEAAVEAGKKFGFQTEIKDKKAIEELGMKAYLQVAKGSVIPPRLIIMRYIGDPESKEILGYVGKGLTYDSGGYSIKPTSSMMTMKCDMGGAASVIGAIAAIASCQEKVNVVAVVAACENMLSGSAYRPGDIIGSMGGKNIEVVNTDAEGRLTLIDAVCYIQKYEKINRVVDIATLTGGAVVALGTIRSAVISNNDKFYNVLEKASDLSGEKIWRMPTDDEYKELIKSDIADLKNSGGRGASMVTAGLFVGEFIKDIPWIHIDIAGKSLAKEAKEYNPEGATGIGVRLLHNLAKFI